MEVLNIIFKLGVILAIFSFIWGIINIAIALLRGGLPLNYPAKLMLKAVQYFLIVNVVVLFSLKNDQINIANSIITGVIIAMYFIGKVQKMKLKFAIIQIQGQQMNKPEKPNMSLEFGLITVAMMFYAFFLFNTELAQNSVAQWFFSSIADIEKTLFFGFIFKIIGFFFTITIIFRLINSINVLLSPKQEHNNNDPYNRNDDDTHFDDYEEVK